MKKYKLVIPKNVEVIFNDNRIDDITIEGKKITREIFSMEEYNDNLDYYKDVPKSWIKIMDENNYVYKIIDFFKNENSNKAIIFRYSERVLILKKAKNLIQKITINNSEYVSIEELEDFLKRKARGFSYFIIVDFNPNWISKAYQFYVSPRDVSVSGGTGEGRITTWLKEFPDVEEHEYLKDLNSTEYLNKNFFLSNSIYG